MLSQPASARRQATSSRTRAAHAWSLCSRLTATVLTVGEAACLTHDRESAFADDAVSAILKVTGVAGGGDVRRAGGALVRC